MAVKRSADLAGKDFSAEAIDLMEEALEMRRCPGIIFAEGPASPDCRYRDRDPGEARTEVQRFTPGED